MGDVATAPEILDSGAQLIRAGWCRETYQFYDAVCTLGALQRAAFGSSLTRAAGLPSTDPRVGPYRQAIVALVDALAAQFPEVELKHWRLVGFENFCADVNDMYAKDAEEIAGAMEKAAINLQGV